jgi:hypothetical protein
LHIALPVISRKLHVCPVFLNLKVRSVISSGFIYQLIGNKINDAGSDECINVIGDGVIPSIHEDKNIE